MLLFTSSIKEHEIKAQNLKATAYIPAAFIEMERVLQEINA